MVLNLSFPGSTYFPNFNFFSFQDLSHKALHPSAPCSISPFATIFTRPSLSIITITMIIVTVIIIVIVIIIRLLMIMMIIIVRLLMIMILLLSLIHI